VVHDHGLGSVSKLPFSIKVLLEAVLRNCNGTQIKESGAAAPAGWSGEIAPSTFFHTQLDITRQQQELARIGAKG